MRKSVVPISAHITLPQPGAQGYVTVDKSLYYTSDPNRIVLALRVPSPNSSALLCDLSASASSDVVEFGASCPGSVTFECARESARVGFPDTEKICGPQDFAGVSRDVRRPADEVAVFAVLADSAFHASLP